MDTDTKLDLVISELRSIRVQIDKKFEQIDKKFEQIDQKLANIEADNKKEHSLIFERLDSLDKNIERLDRRITSLKADNSEDHLKMKRQLDSINSAFIRYETDGIDKIKVLFDSDEDRKNHQDIYGHEFQRLNDLVAKNSFRISNLEEHFN